VSAAAQQSSSRNRIRVQPSLERSIHEVLAAYEGGDDRAVERWVTSQQGRSSLASLETVIVMDTTPWRRAKPAFVLEAVVAMTGTRTLSSRAASLLTAGAAQMAGRPTPLGVNPEEDRFELLWYQAAIGVAQGLQQYWLQQDLLDIVAQRCRDVPRLVDESRIPLARGIAAAGLCCWKRVPGEVVQIVQPSERRHMRVEQAIALFEEAAKKPALSVEALVRGAVLLHKVERDAQALAWFDRVPPHQDRALGYVHHLNYARVLDGTSRAEGAVTAYRAALDYEPASQLPAIGLAAALMRTGRADEAVAAAAAAKRLAAEKVGLNYDLTYQRADSRFVAGWLEEIRRMRTP
jgi:tetratricopeptide (TPR) repeat protein